MDFSLVISKYFPYNFLELNLILQMVCIRLPWRKNLGKKTLWASLISLIVGFIFFELTNTDIILQNHFFNFPDKTWYFKDPTNIYKKIFYNGIKFPIYVIGLGALGMSLVSWKKKLWPEYRKGLLIVTLTIILLPSSIALVGKNLSNVQCPDDLNIYRGIIPYVKHLEPYPINPNSPDGKWFKGRCWPAGHASGGFALLALVCLFKSRRKKMGAFIFAMSMGWIMGVFQMIRGNHFLSHHLTTMFLALILVSLLNIFIKDFTHESSSVKKQAGPYSY